MPDGKAEAAARRLEKLEIKLAEKAVEEAEIEATRAFQKTGSVKAYNKIMEPAKEKLAKIVAKMGARHLAVVPFGPLGEGASALADVYDLGKFAYDTLSQAKGPKSNAKEKQAKRLAAKKRRARLEGAVDLPESPAESLTTDED